MVASMVGLLALAVAGAAPDQLSCAEGTTRIGDPPPAGYRQWCAYRGSDGKLVFQGGFRQWHDDDGTLELEGEFDRGQRHGHWYEYDHDGKRVVDSVYVRDVLAVYRRLSSAFSVSATGELVTRGGKKS